MCIFDQKLGQNRCCTQKYVKNARLLGQKPAFYGLFWLKLYFQVLLIRLKKCDLEGLEFKSKWKGVQVDLVITQPLTSGVVQLFESNTSCVQIGANAGTPHISIPPGNDCTRASGQYVKNERSLSIVIKVTTGCKKVRWTRYFSIRCVFRVCIWFIISGDIMVVNAFSILMSSLGLFNCLSITTW